MAEVFVAIIAENNPLTYSIKQAIDELYRKESTTHIVTGWMCDLLVHLKLESPDKISQAHKIIRRLPGVSHTYLMQVVPPHRQTNPVVKFEARKKAPLKILNLPVEELVSL